MLWSQSLGHVDVVLVHLYKRFMRFTYKWLLQSLVRSKIAMESETNYVDLVASLFVCFCNVLTTNDSSQGSASESVFGSIMKPKTGSF